VTTREKLHRLVDELNEAGAEAAHVRLARERNAVQAWAQTDDAAAVEDAWSLANAREAIREEPCKPAARSAGSSSKRTL
jgi:hypothetical protein